MIRRSVFVYVAVIALMLAGIVLPEALGASRAGYSSAANYLSELGETGAPTRGLTNGLAFPVVALSCISLFVALWHRWPATTAVRAGLVCLLIGIPLGYLGAVAFPCDAGCPIEGTAKQSVHNLLGLVQYPLGILGFFLLGLKLRIHPALRALCLVAAAAMALGFVMMVNPGQTAWRGGWQRLGDYTAFVVLGWLSLSSQPRIARGSLT